MSSTRDSIRSAEVTTILKALVHVRETFEFKNLTQMYKVACRDFQRVRCRISRAQIKQHTRCVMRCYADLVEDGGETLSVCSNVDADAVKIPKLDR